jgi:hypothetical protein
VSVKTAPWQKPWLMEFLVPGPFMQEQVTGIMWRMVQRTPYRRALILIGMDDGYWREERVVERDIGWWATTDSHRGPAAERAISVIGPELAQLYDRINQVCVAPPAGSLVPHPGWIEENEQAQTAAVPILIYHYGGKAMVARGFQFDRWLWSLLEKAKAPPEAPPRYEQ